MSIIVPKYRVFDDADSVKDNLALAMMRTPEPEFARFWDLIPFRPSIRQLNYDLASRSITSRTVVLQNAILTGDTDIDLTSGTKTRISGSYVVFHPATKQLFVLDDMNQTTGTANIRQVLQRDGGTRTQVNAGQELLILAPSEHFDEINADSYFEETATGSNYVQDSTWMYKFSVADLREARKWDINKQRMLKERNRDMMKELNAALLYNAPKKADASNSAMTAGFDYVVEKDGLVVDADASGTAALADIRGILKTLVQRGVTSADGLVLHMSSDAYYAYEEAGLADFNLQLSAEEQIFAGNGIKGINFSGLGPVPFYPDHTVTDDRVRFVATAHAGKSYYQGTENGAPVEAPTMYDELSMSNSKVQVSTLQTKWGTVWENVDKVHAILDNTGL